MTGRRRLPDRREQLTEAVAWENREWLIGVGFGPDGAAREVFLTGSKAGSTMDALTADAAVLMSLLLQHGVTAAELHRHLAREGTDPMAPAASLLGLVAQTVAHLSGLDPPT